MLYHIEQKDSRLFSYPVNDLLPLPHIHTHLEMILLTSGSSMSTVDGHKFLIEAGDIFLAFPHQIHFYHDLTPVSGLIFIFPIDFYRELKEIFQSKIPFSPIIKAKDIPPDVTARLTQAECCNRSDKEFDRIAAKGYLLSVLGELLPCMNLQPSTGSHDSIKSILSYCSVNYTEPISLDTLSEDLHLSKYYISHIFKERMGISFTDFINSLRVEHACSMLVKGANITEVAFSSGFSSIRTFNRAFAKNMGMSPRDYVKKN